MLNNISTLIGEPAAARFAAYGFLFDAPVLAFVSATDPDSDNTQDFTADFTGTIQGYVVRLVGTFGSATVSSPYDVDSSNTIDAGEQAALEAAFTTGALSDGVWSFKCRVENGSGGALSPWSNTVSKTITTTSKLLMETGDRLLLEIGDFLLLEA